MNMKHLLAAGLVALPLMLAHTAQANPEMAGQRGLSDSFAAMDYNQDGKFDSTEFARAHPDLRPEAFAAIDINKDKVIIREEWDNFVKGHKMKMDMPAPAPSSHAPHGITPPKDGKPVAPKGDKPVAPIDGKPVAPAK